MLTIISIFGILFALVITEVILVLANYRQTAKKS
jgi:hypothetical protein